MDMSKQFNHQLAPADVVRHFQSTPWAIKLFSDPTLQPFTIASRIVKPSHTGDTFIGRTLSTNDTIIAWQSFYKSPPPGSFKHETISILKLGSGVNGHPDICHGGFVSSLLDEVIGTAAEDIRPHDKSTMTAYLKIDYKKPIPTPVVIMCRGWVEKIEGRKIYGKGTVEDGEGGIMAFGEALFIIIEKVTPKRKL